MKFNKTTGLVGVVTFSIAAMILFRTSLAAAQTITEFALPTTASGPAGITTGPDGAIWFVEVSGNKIGRITTGGAITEFPIPTPKSSPQCIVSGPDGALWFVEGDGNKIGRITTAGIITEFQNFSGGWPQCLVAGPDGALWIADQGPRGGGPPGTLGNGWIGRITTAGVLTKFPVPTINAQPSWITVGPDGALWFTYSDVNKIGRITTVGAVTEYTVPTPSVFGATLGGITVGPDGALWFTENAASKIGRITTGGTITEFALPANTNPGWIVAGPDGALWFTESGTWSPTLQQITGGGQKIGRITTGGTITEYAIPTANSIPGGIIAGPDGALWFGEMAGNRIARLALPPPPPSPTQTVAPAPADPAQTVAPPPAAQTSYAVSTGQLPTAAVTTAATGRLGSATVIVTLDLSKVFSSGSFAAAGQFAASYSIYVVALLPSGVLGLPSAAWFMYPATRAWATLGFPIAAFVEGLTPTATNSVVIPILQGMDVTRLVGTELYVGYGTSDTEMLSARRYRGVYKVQ